MVTVHRCTKEWLSWKQLYNKLSISTYSFSYFNSYLKTFLNFLTIAYTYLKNSFYEIYSYKIFPWSPISYRFFTQKTKRKDIPAGIWKSAHSIRIKKCSCVIKGSIKFCWDHQFILDKKSVWQLELLRNKRSPCSVYVLLFISTGHGLKAHDIY